MEEKLTAISEALYNYREMAKEAYKEDYEKEIQPYKDKLLSYMKEFDISPFYALVRIICKNDCEQDFNSQMLQVAATCELMEES